MASCKALADALLSALVGWALVGEGPHSHCYSELGQGMLLRAGGCSDVRAERELGDVRMFAQRENDNKLYILFRNDALILSFMIVHYATFDYVRLIRSLH